MNSRLYTRYEIKRAFRNRAFFVFSFGFPLVLYFLIAGTNRHVHNFGGSGVTAPVYYMAALASFGTMASMISTGGRIAGERQVGWTRQLRISPLPPTAYFRAKLLTAYTMALLSMGLLYVAGIALGVSLSARTWLEMTALILIALLPFAALGIFLGHRLSVDAVGPLNGWTRVAARTRQRDLVPRHTWLPARRRPVPAFVLARPGRPGSRAGTRLERHGLVRRHWVDGAAGGSRRRGLSGATPSVSSVESFVRRRTTPRTAGDVSHDRRQLVERLG